MLKVCLWCDWSMQRLIYRYMVGIFVFAQLVKTQSLYNRKHGQHHLVLFNYFSIDKYQILDTLGMQLVKVYVGDIL